MTRSTTGDDARVVLEGHTPRTLDGWREQLELAAGDRPMPWTPLAQGIVIRRTPDDFVVEELPALEPCGSGEHLWVEIEKVSENSDTVARALAEAVGVRAVDVGFAGRKDRHARARQWFSVRWPYATRPQLDEEKQTAADLSAPLQAPSIESFDNRTPHARDRAPRVCGLGVADEAQSDDPESPVRDVAEAALHRLNMALAARFSGDGGSTVSVRVVRGAWHSRKLQTGFLRGNRFRIVIEPIGGGITDDEINDVEDAGAEAEARAVFAERIGDRVAAIVADGVPNYFGAQRFGRRNLVDGINRLAAGLLATADSVAEASVAAGGNPASTRTRRGGARRRGFGRDRNSASLAWSALRSAVFNAVLAARVRDGSWARLLPGERVQLDGTGSFFVCDEPGLDRDLRQRFAIGDVHTSGPLVGRGRERDTAAGLASPPAIEGMVLARYAPLERALADVGLEAARRPLRMVVRDFEWRVVDRESSRVELRFELPPGAFATTVLEAIAPVHDAAKAAAAPDGDRG